jgi:hypothetical protein
MSNLSFKKWFNLRESDDYSPDMKNALEIFMKPEEIFEISPASIADGNLTNTHKPFIYLESTDTVYLGIDEGYHNNLIFQKIKQDPNIGLELRKAYDGIHQSDSDVAAAVGRIGYKVNFAKLQYRLPANNIKKFLYGDDETNWPEIIKKLAVIPYPIKQIFDQIDLISIYQTPIPIAASSCKKLQENGEIRDPLKTVVLLNKKAYMFNELITHASSPSSGEEYLDKKEEPKITTQQSKERSRRFIPKPETIRQAAYQAGIPMGDWTNYANMFRGNNYHG